MPTLVQNKKYHLSYEALEEIEAGIELYGFEVKSLRAKHGSLAGAYIVVRGGEAFLVNAQIPPYQPENTPKEYDPYRTRRLLLSKREIARIADAESKKGLTVVPVSLYTKGRTIKLSCAIARGKKKHDKRETIKRKDMQRDMERELKQRFK